MKKSIFKTIAVAFFIIATLLLSLAVANMVNLVLNQAKPKILLILKSLNHADKNKTNGAFRKHFRRIFNICTNTPHLLYRINLNHLKNYEMKTFELTPVNGRKSFGGKARVIVENNKAKLLSYDTIVAEYDLKSKKFVINGEYSKTTNTHINSFKSFYKIN